MQAPHHGAAHTGRDAQERDGAGRNTETLHLTNMHPDKHVLQHVECTTIHATSKL